LRFRIKAPGKLILLGEYAVLEGADALVASVDRYVVVEISSSSNTFCQISSNLINESFNFTVDKNGKIKSDNDQSEQLLSTMKFVLSIINKTCQHILTSGFQIQSFNLEIDTSQFYINNNQDKIGLGSSAALTVALIMSLAKFHGADKILFKDKYDLFRFAYDTHFFVQGNRGSGVDIAASVYGGINVYNIKSSVDEDKIRQIIPISILEELYILTIWSGISVSTRKLLVEVENFRSRYAKNYEGTISRLSTLSSSGCESYAEKKQADFLDIVKDYYEVLKNFSILSKIPIISDVHKKIAEIVYGSGGIYKTSGAGGGDIGIAFSDSKKTLERVKNELAQNKIETISLGISKEGVIIVD